MFAFVAAEKANWPVALMCRVLEVSASGFYAWLVRPPSQRECQDAWLTDKIEAIHKENRGVYGVRRIHACLRRLDIRISKKRVHRLMKLAGVSGLVKKKRGKTTVSIPGVETAGDLVRRYFNPTGPNALWVADITYIRTWEGWLYLAAVMDCYSRKIVGWQLADSLRAEIVVDALSMAVKARRPAPGLIHHSDRGSQYTALIFNERCKAAGIDTSMGAKGCAYDNAVAESFFATIKKELINRRSWPTKAETRVAIFEYIEAFYNRIRLHSTIGNLSPVEFEATSSYEEVITTSRQLVITKP